MTKYCAIFTRTQSQHASIYLGISWTKPRINEKQRKWTSI